MGRHTIIFYISQTKSLKKCLYFCYQIKDAQITRHKMTKHCIKMILIDPLNKLTHLRLQLEISRSLKPIILLRLTVFYFFIIFYYVIIILLLLFNILLLFYYFLLLLLFHLCYYFLVLLLLYYFYYLLRTVIAIYMWQCQEYADTASGCQALQANLTAIHQF